MMDREVVGPELMDAADHRPFRERALASLVATAGMLVLPLALLLFRAFRPAGPVEVYDYFIPADGWKYPLAAILGVWLAATAYGAVRPRAACSVARLTVGCLLGASVGLVLFVTFLRVASWLGRPGPVLGAGLLFSGVVSPMGGAWLGGVALFRSTEPAASRFRRWVAPALAAALLVCLLMPRYPAFPASGSLTERQTWCREHVPQYASLARLVERTPGVVDSVGHIAGIAPTAGGKHSAAVDMNGVDTHFALDVVGDKGSGVFHADCTPTTTWSTAGAPAPGRSMGARSRSPRPPRTRSP